RHTRFSRDWSSDVCSSDLFLAASSSRYRGFGSPIASANLRTAPLSTQLTTGRERRPTRDCHMMPPPLGFRTAGHVEHLAVDVGCLFRREEQERRRNILRLADPADRNLLFDLLKIGRA